MLCGCVCTFACVCLGVSLDHVVPVGLPLVECDDVVRGEFIRNDLYGDGVGEPNDSRHAKSFSINVRARDPVWVLYSEAFSVIVALTERNVVRSA
jgi:hypothetical protein